MNDIPNDQEPQDPIKITQPLAVVENPEDQISLEELLAALAEVDVKALCMETAQWLANNVDEYIDTTKFEYIVSITPTEDMPVSRSLQELCSKATTALKIDMDEIVNLTEMLNDPEVTREAAKSEAITDFFENTVFPAFVDDREAKALIFKGLSKYYRVGGMHIRPNEEGTQMVQKVLEKEVDGAVTVNYFMYENFEMEIKVKQVVLVKGADGEEHEEKRLVNQESLPPAYTIEFDVQVWDKKPELSLF